MERRASGREREREGDGEMENEREVYSKSDCKCNNLFRGEREREVCSGDMMW